MVPTREVRLIDSLNGKAYAYRYEDLDSSRRYAGEAYRLARFYKSGKAEASNNLGFDAFMQMDFDRSAAEYKSVYKQTKNELELLIADIGLMRICQRTAMNKEFYDYRNSALRRMKRIREDSDLFADRHEALRLEYAFSEFHLVSAVYYYYLQQRQEAMDAIAQVSEEEVEADTNQLLYYHYIRGSASLVEGKKPEERKMEEFDHLYLTWRIAVQSGQVYFEGNGLQGMANLLIDTAAVSLFRSRRPHALQQFGQPVDTLLPLRLAQVALGKFRDYGDLYRVAGTYVTIGKYLNVHGRYAEALDTLSKALDCVNQHHSRYYHPHADSLDLLRPYAAEDTTYTGVPWIARGLVKTAPEWISRIREQLSVSYAGLGMKQASDYNRNIYLDILNYSRQDKELESRYQSLESDARQTTLLLFVVLGGVVLLALLWWIFNKRSKTRNQVDIERLQRVLSLCKDITSSIPMDVPLIQRGIDNLFGKGRLTLDTPEGGRPSLVSHHRLNKDERALVHVLMPYIDWVADNEQVASLLSEERLHLEKQRYVFEQHIAENKRQNIVKKACLAIVNGITPYIDRILNETHKLIERGYIDDEKIKKEKYQYIEELVGTINEYNDILALWIQMKQGSLSLNIETFDLDALFGLLGKGRRAFELKRQRLEIESTNAQVKADRALTLFMINTLAENARKYTPEGGTIKVYAREAESYVEISVEDNGRGISPADVELIRGNKVYNSQAIGMSDAENPEELRGSKGSGFGLMNCKGIVEKYRKTNKLFDVCLFDVESELGRGSRFYFRLPQGMRKVLGTLLFGLLLPFALASCDGSKMPLPSLPVAADTIAIHPDSVYAALLDTASSYANAAYYANVDGDYRQAITYVDTAMSYLNAHYEKYAPADAKRHYLRLTGEGTPAEIGWWNDLFDTDYHVILDIRNEAAVAFLALKQLDAYAYNNTAFTDLYKLQSEDKTLESYCRELERSNTNRIVGILLCVALLTAGLIGYYLLYWRKRWQSRFGLEQVLEINQKVFAASLPQGQADASAEALEREENMLRQIPQRIVDEAFRPVNELLMVNRMGIAVYNDSLHRLEYASYPKQEMPEAVGRCFDQGVAISEHAAQAIPLMVEATGERRCVGVLYVERRERFDGHTDRLLVELVARYVAIVVFNAVVKMAMKYRDIESAHEEANRASREDSLLHVQNMVLDNCLSTIKHETVYYPNRIKQIIARLNGASQPLAPEEERESVRMMTELIEYYKGIFTILSSCASRQLEEVTFRRGSIGVGELMEAATKYFRKLAKRDKSAIDLTAEPIDAKVTGDFNLLCFLLENLIDEALTVDAPGALLLQAREEEDYVRFLFTDTRRDRAREELNRLFYPSLSRMTASDKGQLQGTEYLVCKQIIRDHDEFAGRRGCRINAEPAPDGGFTVYFTVPVVKRKGSLNIG
jgi:K+-sensing histidine kinase KdpD